MTEQVDVQLPTTLREAVRVQVGLTMGPPYEALITVGANAALMCAAWFLLPPSLKDDLFSLHGTLAFALVLASWMYSDVPATNVLGPDAERAAAAIADPVMFRRLILAKNIALWLIVSPACALVALAVGLYEHDRLAALYTIVWIGVVPFGFLAISAWVGILFPYHALPLRYRWEHRTPRKRMLVRWLGLALVPYGLVPVLALALMTPSLLLWGFTSAHGLSQKLPDNDLGLGVALACVISLVCCVVGHRIGSTLAQRRQMKLTEFLHDPLRG